MIRTTQYARTTADRLVVEPPSEQSSRSPRLRIGIVAPPFLPIPPPGYGGIERVVSVLVESLVEHGHDVTLFASAGSTTSAHMESPLTIPPTLGDPAAMGDEFCHTTAAYLHAAEFDIVHDHTDSGPALGAMLGGTTPVVHTLHGPWTEHSRRLLGLIDDRVGLVAISQAQRAANPQLHYAGVVYNGIDLAAHPFNAVKEDFVVFLGRISPEKRPEIAIDVAREAKLPLVMIIKRSEPAERAYWDEIVAPRLSDEVTVLDEPPHAVKVDLLGRARAMLFPIDWPEPFGLVMTEAMACGTPVIARPLGAAPEIIVDGVTGFLCSTPARMVEAVISSKTLRPEECRARVERHFSAPVMVDGYERIYREALAGARRQSPASRDPSREQHEASRATTNVEGRRRSAAAVVRAGA